MQTEKLYYHDPYLREFTATILKQSPLPGGQYAITLDRTALVEAAPTVAALADAEGLAAHAESVRRRVAAPNDEVR